jgi:hypothetical protein
LNGISLEQQLSAELNRTEFDRLLIEQPYEYKAVFLNRVCPDSSNPRFFPVVIIPNQVASQVASKRMSKQQLIERYDAQNKVVIGKSCIVNCLPNSSSDWNKANITIDSIMELAANVAVSEIIQAPTLFPLDDGNYQILTGHRRFFAMLYANGLDTAAHFKVYDQRPMLPKTKQFQENASREELPQYGKLQAFQDAMLEIETLSKLRFQSKGKTLTVRDCANILGISMGAYDNYNVLTRYPAVIAAYHAGCSLPFVKMKKIVLEQEQQFKDKFGVTRLNIDHKNKINQQIKKELNVHKDKTPSVTKTSYRLAPFKSADMLRYLLMNNMLELDSGVDWQQLDWTSPTKVNEAIAQLVSFIEKENLQPTTANQAKMQQND